VIFDPDAPAGATQSTIKTMRKEQAIERVVEIARLAGVGVVVHNRVRIWTKTHVITIGVGNGGYPHVNPEEYFIFADSEPNPTGLCGRRKPRSSWVKNPSNSYVKNTVKNAVQVY
jgi:hypothetical protein